MSKGFGGWDRSKVLYIVAKGSHGVVGTKVWGRPVLQRLHSVYCLERFRASGKRRAFDDDGLLFTSYQHVATSPLRARFCNAGKVGVVVVVLLVDV